MTNYNHRLIVSGILVIMLTVIVAISTDYAKTVNDNEATVVSADVEVIEDSTYVEPEIISENIKEKESFEEVSVESLLPNEEVASQVLRGEWGTGNNRKEALESAGYIYEDIQEIVNGNNNYNCNEFVPSPQEVSDDIKVLKDDSKICSDGRYIGNMRITGYTAEEGFYAGKTTASGCGVGYGQCAMNNAQRKALGLNYGDTIIVEGLGTYTITDCGCKWGVVDIWCETNAEAYAMTGYKNVYLS